MRRVVPLLMAWFPVLLAIPVSGLAGECEHHRPAITRDLHANPEYRMYVCGDAPCVIESFGKEVLIEQESLGPGLIGCFATPARKGRNSYTGFYLLRGTELLPQFIFFGKSLAPARTGLAPDRLTGWEHLDHAHNGRSDYAWNGDAYVELMPGYLSNRRNAWSGSLVGDCFSSLRDYMQESFPGLEDDENITASPVPSHDSRVTYYRVADNTPSRNVTETVVAVKADGVACVILYAPSSNGFEFAPAPDGHLPPQVITRSAPFTANYATTQVTYALDPWRGFYLPTHCARQRDGKSEDIDCKDAFLEDDQPSLLPGAASAPGYRHSGAKKEAAGAAPSTHQ